VKIIRQLYLGNRLFLCVGIVVMLFISTFVLGGGYFIPEILTFLLLCAVATDLVLLFRTTRGMRGERMVADKL
jgi:hypothetical protein